MMMGELLKDRICVAVKSPKGVCRFHVLTAEEVSIALADGYTFPHGIMMRMDRRGTVLIDDVEGVIW